MTTGHLITLCIPAAVPSAIRFRSFDNMLREGKKES